MRLELEDCARHRAEQSGPTITDHETTNGRRVVSDLWVDGTVGFSFDEGSEVLVEKDC